MILASSESSLSLALAAIVVLGVGCQWIGQRLRIPSIILLLGAGLLAGPVTGVVNPDEQFGPLLFPLASLGVGILLFEGGLDLRLDTFTQGRGVVVRLVTLGVIVTWLIGIGGAVLLLDVDTDIAVLNVVAQERLAMLLTRKHIYELRDGGNATEPRVVGSVIARRAFNGQLSHQVLEETFNNGGRLLTTRSDEVGPNHTVLMSVDADRGVNLAADQGRLDGASAVVVLASPTGQRPADGAH